MNGKYDIILCCSDMNGTKCFEYCHVRDYWHVKYFLPIIIFVLNRFFFTNRRFRESCFEKKKFCEKL